MDVAAIYKFIQSQLDEFKRDLTPTEADASFDIEWGYFEKFGETLLRAAFDGNDEQEEKVYFDVVQRRTHEDKIRLVLENKPLAKLTDHLAELVLKDKRCDKDGVKAKEFRTSGNKAYAEGKYLEAMEKYNRAIEVCPYSSSKEDNELALCLSNRSAVLIHQQEFNDSIQDIKDAILFNYPEDRLHVLTERLLQCYKHIQNDKPSKSDIEDLETHIKNKSAGDILREKIRSLKNVKSATINTTKRNINTTITEPNKLIPKGSNAVRMNHSPSKGRFIEADRDISPSEVLFTETAYVHWLKPSNYNFFCAHCLKFLVSNRFLPCKHCSEIKYCSRDCLDAAWQQYHRYECQFMHVLKYLSVGALAFKAVLLTGVKKAMELSKQDKIPPNEYMSTTYNSDYKSILNLVEHGNELQPKVLTSLIIGSIFLANVTTKMKLVEESQLEKMACLLLKHALQFNCNAIAVLFDDRKDYDGYQTLNAHIKPIGMGVYPTVSLLNHACYTQVYVLFNGTGISLKAVDRIKRGNEIAFCYGTHYQKFTYKDRQDILRDFFYFKCECVACSNHWENLGRAFLCTACNIGPVIVNNDNSNYCLKCGNKNMDVAPLSEIVIKIRDLLTTGFASMDEGDKNGVLKAKGKYNEALTMGEKCLYRANDLMIEVHEKLADCFWQEGKYKKATVHWFKCYELTKKVEGSDVNYECLFFLLKITEGLIEEIYSFSDKSKVCSHTKKAGSYFAKAIEVSRNLSGKEYKLLIARNEILENTPVIEEIAARLHQLNILFDK